MREFLIALFGWPGVLAALTIMAVAVVFGSQRLMWIGVLVSGPFLFYVSGYPIVRGYGLVAFACNVGGAIALRHGRRGVAALAALPFVVLLYWIAALVSSQPV